MGAFNMSGGNVSSHTVQVANVKASGKNSSIGTVTSQQGLGTFEVGKGSTTGVTSPVVLAPNITVQSPDTSGGGGAVQTALPPAVQNAQTGDKVVVFGKIGIFVIAAGLALWYFMKRR